MSNVESEIYTAFRSIGVEEDRAMKAAIAFGDRENGMQRTLQEQRDTQAKIMADLLVLKWSQGFTLALVLLVVGKLFIH